MPRMASRKPLPLLAVLLLLAAAAPAQQQQQETADYQCLSFTMLAGPGHGGNTLHQLAQKLPEAIAACEQGVQIRPREGRMSAALGRVRRMAGDQKGALEAAQRGAAMGDAQAKVLLGVLQAGSDPAAALALFRDAARAQEKLANYDLGVLWANGMGVPRNPQDAANFIRLAALGKDPFAMMVLGQWYEQGRGVAADRAQAEAWWRKAAEVMVPEAVPDPLRLAIGEPLLDVPPLLAWYRQQAQAGATWAQAWLGLLHEAGQWVPRDDAAAAFWYRQAGLAGHVESQWRLANMYRQGRGVATDATQAKRWGEMGQVARCERHLAETVGQPDCDRYAGDPYEPGRSGPGADGFCVTHFLQPAIAACRRASSEQPQVARFHAQYARALAHAERFDEARREATVAAGRGSTPAMILLGAMRQRGLDGPRDDKAALGWFRKAAQAGDRRGVMLLLTSAQQGVGVMAGSPEAAALLAEAQQRMLQQGPVVAADTTAAQADKGDPRAQFELAMRYEAQKDYATAIQWYTRAAANGSGGAAMNLAQMYENGIGVPRDSAQALARYTPLADQGNAEARYRLAQLQLQAGNTAEAVLRLRKGVEHAETRSMVTLGELYDQGRGVPTDKARAAALYEQAAPQSNWAGARLGAMALQGDGIPRDYARARRWLEPAAAAGDHSALNNLGLLAEGGLGAAPDYRLARDRYLAALFGAAEARGNLERLYERELGVPADPAEAAQWYRPAAVAGIAAAQWRLGLLYQRGSGVPRDEREALRWLDAAAEQGHVAARKDAGAAWYAVSQRHARGEGGLPRDEQAEREALGRAALYGHPAAVSAVEARFGAEGRAALARARLPPPPSHPTGASSQPDEDRMRKMQVRSAGSGGMQAATMDAGLANVYTVIPWTRLDEKQRR
ncbi:MAG: Sel1 domain protein repeat-containing protein [Ramlibacter sp.]|nr:Sel1 domain protein repeat-containing protein [Ramlibacter sp.]